MADTITLRTSTERDVIKIVERGPQGPQGVPGASQADVLTVQGDLLYRGASAAQRLGIGTAGQILKVNSGGTAPEWGAAPAAGVSSVNGDTGAVSVTPASIDAAEANHDHQPSDIYSDAVKVTATTQSAGEPNGVYFRDGSDNGKATYRSAAGYSIFWDDAEGEWVLGNVPQSQKYFIGSQDTTYPWQVSIAWTLGAQGSGTVPTVGQATLTDYQLNAAQDSVSTRVPKIGNAASTEVVLGSDTRLTNSRTPSAHAASHASAGSDPLAPSDIGAQSLFTSASQVLSADFTLTSGRATKWTLQNYNGTTYNITLPTTNIQAGDVVVVAAGTLVGSQTIREANVGGGSFATLATLSEGQSYRFVSTGTASNSWEIDQVYTHTHAASDITSGTLAHERGGLEADVSAYSGLVKISGGSTSAVTVTSAGEALLDDADAAAQRTTLGLGTAATAATGDFATASHSHGNITNDGKVGSTSGLPLVTTTAGAITTLALGTANQVLRVNSGATGVEFADPAASGGSKSYAIFTATDNNPPATAFATIDQRNSIAVLDFDAATDENAVFVSIMPEAASLGSGLIVRLHWMATSATSGNVRWGVQLERSNTDLDADSFDTAVEATAATNGTSGIITTTAITVTTIDGITAGDVFRLKVFRNADDATNDTMTGDAELVAVEVRSAA